MSLVFSFAQQTLFMRAAVRQQKKDLPYREVFSAFSSAD